jgi:hypothetical protein
MHFDFVVKDLTINDIFKKDFDREIEIDSKYRICKV